MAQFGEKLRKAREQTGITQQTLADQIYVARQTVSRWETGERYPDLLMLKKLSSVLNISVDELLNNGEMPVVVEKSPIIEKPFLNNMIIVLYADHLYTSMNSWSGFLTVLIYVLFIYQMLVLSFRRRLANETVVI